MADTDDPVVIFQGATWQAEQLRGLLEQAGVESFLRDEVMGRIDAPALAAGAIGAVKVVVTREHEAHARVILSDFGGADVPEGTVNEDDALPPWFCVHCGEPCEGQFDVCWNCGAARGD